MANICPTALAVCERDFTNKLTVEANVIGFGMANDRVKYANTPWRQHPD